MDLFSEVVSLNRKANLVYDGKPRKLNDVSDVSSDLHIGFMEKSFNDYKKAVQEQNLEKQFGALIRLAYAVLTTAHIQGFDFNEGFRRFIITSMDGRGAFPDLSDLVGMGDSHYEGYDGKCKWYIQLKVFE